MKIILTLVITLFIFACKPKEETSISPGLVGTYKKTFIQDRIGGAFRDMLPTYDSFTETATLIVTQTSLNSYNLQVTLEGVAKKTNSTVNYGFTTKMTPHVPDNNARTVMLFRGTYDNLTPSSPDFSNDKQTYAEVKYSGDGLEIFVATNYKKDQYPLLYATLPKIK